MQGRKKRRYVLVKWILLGFNVLLAITLLISYSASFIDPAKIWIVSLFGLALPYLLLANFIIAVAWILLRKWYFILSLLVMLIGLSHVTRHISFNDVVEISRDSSYFRVLSYNVHNLISPDGDIPEEHSRKRVFSFLASQDCDIICLQEFKSPKRSHLNLYEEIREATNLPYLESAPYRSGQKLETDALVTLSRYPIISAFAVQRDEQRNLMLVTDILIGNDTIRLFNIHLESFRFGFDDYDFLTQVDLNSNNDEIRDGSKKVLKKLRDANIKRSKEVRQLRTYTQASAFPVIVCGDFNDTPSSFTYAFMSKHLKDAFRESGRGLGNSYAGKLPSFRIDYILYDDHFSSANYMTHRVHYSDHYPISCYITYP